MQRHPATRSAVSITSALPPKVPALTSLRFVAAVMVMLFHSAGRFGFAADADRQSLQFVLATAVSFFFVLSGFVQAFNYADLKTASGTIAYYRARFARIWPLHVAVLAIILLVDPTVPRPWTDATNLQWLPAHVLMVQTWITLDPVGLSAFNAITWTLSTEWFFYLMFPLLIRAARADRWLTLAGAVGIGIATASTAQWLSHQGMNSTHFDAAILEHVNPLARLWEFVLGMALGLAVRERAREPKTSGVHAVGLQLSALLVVMLAATHLKQWVAAASLPPLVADWLHSVGLAPFYAWLLFVLATTTGPIVRMLGSRLAEQLGDLSYGMYLMHIVVLRQPFWWVISNRVRPGVLGFVLFVAVDVTVAWLLSRTVEAPARAWIRGHRPQLHLRIA